MSTIPSNRKLKLTLTEVIELITRIQRLHDKGALSDFNVVLSRGSYHLVMIDRSGGGASIYGHFNKACKDNLGFIDMLLDLEYDLEEDEE